MAKSLASSSDLSRIVPSGGVCGGDRAHDAAGADSAAPDAKLTEARYRRPVARLRSVSAIVSPTP